MNLEARFAAHARGWGASIDEMRSTETSLIGFGTRGDQPVVLKLIRKENSEEWRCGETLRAFDGQGMVQVLESAQAATSARWSESSESGLRNPVDARQLLSDPVVIGRRSRIFEERLECDAHRALTRSRCSAC